jgi:tetratricopeptide (TPR) repeat protein
LDHKTTLEKIQKEPSLWASAFACAWSQIDETSLLPAALLHSDQDEEILIIINAMMANMDLDQASQSLVMVSGGVLPHSLFPLVSSREPELVRKVIEIASSNGSSLSAPSGESLNSLLMNAYLARQNLEYEAASRILHNAQETSDRVNASISDQRAEIARSLDDQELELQARQDAVSYETSPQRRASLAHLLLKMDRHREAKAVLEPEPDSIEEILVQGLLKKSEAEAEDAHEYFVDATVGLGENLIQDFGWSGILLEELRSLGDAVNALEVAQFRNKHLGSDSKDRVAFAQFLLQSGDPIQAMDHAYIAYALSPHSLEAKEILAQALQESDHPAEALAHWNVLSETDNDAILNVARCALDAGFIELAIHTADSLLTNVSYAHDAQLIIGEAHRLNGDLPAAREYFETVIQETPQNIRAWISLAECIESSGDREGAGHTLGTAIQMNPSDPQLLHAHALWLEGEGRLSEALESIEKAFSLESKSYDIQIAYGDLLNKLGHLEKSVVILEKAVSQKPYHWKGMNTYAQVLSQIGEPEAALGVISNLPDSAAPEAHITAGELTIRSAHELLDVDLAIKGIAHLETAIKAGVEDPRIHHWLGIAYETLNENEKAFDAYQTSLKSLPDEEYELSIGSKVGLGRAALSLGQITLATSLLEDAQRRNQKSISLLVALSQAYLQSQKTGKAFEAAEAALDTNPSDRRAIRQITRVASETNNWTLAMQAMKKLVDLKPLEPASWITYAESAAHANNVPEARKALAEALSRWRRDPETLAKSANVMIDLDLPHSAFRWLSRAIKLEPDNANTLRSLARVAESIGDMSTAQSAWTRCVELDPTDVATLKRAAQAHWELGLRAGAMDLWEKAYQVEPDDTSLGLQIAGAHGALGNNTDGLNLLQKVLANEPDNIDLAVECSNFAIDLGEPAFAVDCLEGLLSKAPTRNDVLLSLAESYLATGRTQVANEVLQSIVIEHSTPDRWLPISAIAALRIGDSKRALIYYRAGLKIKGGSSRDRVLLSKTALALGRWKEALELVDQHSADEAHWDIFLARAIARIRILELSEIYKNANVERNNPLAALSEVEEQVSVEQLINQAVKKMAPKRMLEGVRIRSALISHSLDTNLWNEALMTLQSMPSCDVIEALAIAGLRSGKYQEAVETIALRDDLSVESEWLDILAGIAQHSLGQFSASHKSFQNAETNPTLLPLSKYLSSKSLTTLEDRASAIEHLQAAVEIWHDEGKWQYQLGKLLTLDGNLDLALPHLQEAAELAPTNSEYRMTLAKALKDSGHFSQAYEYYKIAVEQKSSDGMIWLEAGQLAHALGDYPQAAKYYQQACELSPAEPTAFTGAAKAALQLGDSKSAMKLVRTAMNLAPEMPEVLVTLGEILANQGKTEKALQSIDLAIPRMKDPLPLRVGRARLLVQLNQPSKAMEEMKTLTDLHPENEDIWAGYAEICEETENLVIGVEAANRATNLAPNNHGFHLLLARLCRKSGQLDRALDELSRLEQKSPTNAKVLTELGMLYEDRRQYTEALDAYNRSIECNGNSSIPYLRAGVVLSWYMEEFARWRLRHDGTS